jgi:hypothetical protein
MFLLVGEGVGPWCCDDVMRMRRVMKDQHRLSRQTVYYLKFMTTWKWDEK